MIRSLFAKQKIEKDETGVMHVAGKPLPYTIERSKRRKRTIAFTITSQATLRVIVPIRTKLSTIYEVLGEQSAGLIQNLLLKHDRTKAYALSFKHGAELRYLGHVYFLYITQNIHKAASLEIRPRRMIINIPLQNLSPQELEDEVKLEFTLWLKKRARAKLKKRTDLWAERMGVSYKKLIISSPEQRWGSCSVDNTIRLNWRLMLAPLPLIDYVVAHELAHCLHKNHGPRFWRFLLASIPDSQVRRRQLRQLGNHLFF